MRGLEDDLRYAGQEERMGNQQTVRRAIEDLVGHAAAGDRLPPERQLAEQFGVARMTVRRATNALVSEGRLERRQGSGTYVRRPVVATRMQLTSFTDDMLSRGIVPSSRLIDASDVTLTRSAARLLRATPGSRAHRVTRVRLGDGEPIGVETVTIPDWTGFVLTSRDLAGSMYGVLRSRYEVEVTSAQAEISVDVPSHAIALLLDVPRGTACMRITMVDADQHGRRIMVATCWYRADRYRVHLGTSRPATKAVAS
jgi:GntR family transcriptional regulator